MLRVISRRPEVSVELGDSASRVWLSCHVRTSAAEFVGKIRVDPQSGRGPEQQRLESHIDEFQSLYEDIARRATRLGCNVPRTDVLACPWKEVRPGEYVPVVESAYAGPQLTPAEWKDRHLQALNSVLNTLADQRRSAASVPPEIEAEVRDHLMPLLKSQRHVRAGLFVLYEDLFHEITAENGISRLPSKVVPLSRRDQESDRFNVLYRGIVWESWRELSIQQWRSLADSYLAHEDSEILRLAGGDSAGEQRNREAISSAIRRAVWLRDQGRCVKCGARERLEYDHIIPVSQGGANTERNIELLCERCNRSKGGRIL